MYYVVALYHFTSLSDLPALQAEVRARAQDAGICGTLLLAPEGINGTIAAPDKDKITAFADWLIATLNIDTTNVKWSTAAEQPFKRLKIRLKREIVTLKRPEADPSKQVGTYVSPAEWDAITADPDVVLLDTRNIYETDMGIFKNAVDPRINTFSEFADYVEKNMDPSKTKKVAMFCTGGIRCEKASSFMLSRGFETVYHLKGGILKYLETVPAERSTWQGDCFVFDERIALGHGLSEADKCTLYGDKA